MQPPFCEHDGKDAVPPYYWIDQGQVDHVVAARRTAIQRSGLLIPDPLRHRADGRLIAYAHGVTLCDGAMLYETGGFFDEIEGPPWDTWVGTIPAGGGPDGDGRSRFHLVCWIPTAAIAIVDAGRAVDSYEMYEWLDEPRPGATHFGGVPSWLRRVAIEAGGAGK